MGVSKLMTPGSMVWVGGGPKGPYGVFDEQTKNRLINVAFRVSATPSHWAESVAELALVTLGVVKRDSQSNVSALDILPWVPLTLRDVLHYGIPSCGVQGCGSVPTALILLPTQRAGEDAVPACCIHRDHGRVVCWL
jgi:hypothetical protein